MPALTPSRDTLAGNEAEVGGIHRRPAAEETEDVRRPALRRFFCCPERIEAGRRKIGSGDHSRDVDPTNHSGGDACSRR